MVLFDLFRFAVKIVDSLYPRILFFHILLIIEQNMKIQRQTYTHSFTHTLIQNVQSLENHTQVIILKVFSFLAIHIC